MSDYAPAWLTVYECPEENREAAFEVIAEHFDGTDWSFDIEPYVSGDLTLGALYTVHEGRLGIADEVASALIDLGCSFEVWQEAKYEYDGEAILYTPELGRFDGTQGCSDTLLVSAYDLDRAVQQWMDEGAAGLALVNSIDTLTGKAWRDRMAELRKHIDEPAPDYSVVVDGVTVAVVHHVDAGPSGA